VLRKLEKVPGSGVVLGILSTSTIKDSAVTFGGTAINGLLGAIFYILAARFLGPESFGLLSVSIAVLTLIADIGDLGTDTGLVNFVAKYSKSDPEKVKKYLKLGLEIKLLVSFLVLVAGFYFANYLSVHVFAKPELTQTLRIAFIGVGALLLFSFITHVLQALQKFWLWSGIQVGTNALRVVFVVAALISGFLSLESTMWLYVSVPLLGFIIGLFYLPKGICRVTKESTVAGEFFKYNKWVAAFTLVAALAARIDTFITARLLTSFELGIYSAANQMVKIVPQLVVALGTVMAPKMASMSSDRDLLRYIKKGQILVFALVTMGVAAIPLVIYFIPFVFGSQYVSAGPVFIILLFAMLIFLFSVPVHMAVFYYFSYPKLFFWLSLLSLSVISISGWYLISRFGVFGAAYSVLLGQSINFVIPAVWVYLRLRPKR
jgi:O-antigen/teichoic acid export membrane protein